MAGWLVFVVTNRLYNFMAQGGGWKQFLKWAALYMGVVIPIKLEPFFSSECLSSDSNFLSTPSVSVGNVIPEVLVIQKAMHLVIDSFFTADLTPLPTRLKS